jgi:hypothetical protein
VAPLRPWGVLNGETARGVVLAFDFAPLRRLVADAVLVLLGVPEGTLAVFVRCTELFTFALGRGADCGVADNLDGDGGRERCIRSLGSLSLTVTCKVLAHHARFVGSNTNLGGFHETNVRERT